MKALVVICGAGLRRLADASQRPCASHAAIASRTRGSSAFARAALPFGDVAASSAALRFARIAVRPMAYLSLAFDHRVVDGAVGDQFMATIKQQLEHWDPSAT